MTTLQAAHKTAKTGQLQGTITIAVAGNPNSGKSTLINAIAGSRLHVGNWPGVTVEKKEATFDFKGRTVRLVDLPGTYSLSPYSQEEVIARDYLITERPDVIINVVDSTNLERNLYLTIQLLEIGLPVVIALNIFDEARAKGYEFDIKALSEALNCPVIPTVATKREGLEELLASAIKLAEFRLDYKHHHLNYGEDINEAVLAIERYLTENCPDVVTRYPLRWLSYKLIESDPLVLEHFPYDKCPIDVKVTHIKLLHNEDLEAYLSEARYALASGLTREVLKRPPVERADLTERIDRVALNRYLGIPVFLAAMWLVFKLTFDISQPLSDWFDKASTGPIKRIAETVLTTVGLPQWVVSLITDGVIAGVGMVLTFVPVIFVMMFFITFLEGSGYMARAAFVMDRAMHSIGLHGKSFIPMLLGFGCNVPAIYATRTLENPKDKALTALLVPFMSCGARLPVYVLFVGVFFAEQAGTVLWSLYLLGIVVAILTGLVFKRLLFKGESPVFIMELPPYRMPSMKNLLVHTWEKGKHFLIKAGTYILAVSILVWFLLNTPWGVEHKKDSLLGLAGQAIAPIFEPLGFGKWEAASALITGVIAKEIIVSTMGEIYATDVTDTGDRPSIGEDIKELFLGLLAAVKDAVVNVFSSLMVTSLKAEEEDGPTGLKAIIQSQFSPLSAYAFMAFVLLYMPCMVVGIALRQEFGTWKWFGLAFVYQMLVAWLMAYVIYQGGSLLGFGG